MSVTDATVSPISALRAYEATVPAYEELSTADATKRATAAIDTIIRNYRGTNPIESLADAVGVTRGTVYHWRKMKRHISPSQAYRCAVAYCAPSFPASREETDRYDQDPTIRAAAERVFDLLYSDNHRAALTWLIEHGPAHFGWNAADHSTMVA